MSLQQLTRGALLLAVGVVLPQVFHLFGGTAGTVFLPMHIPVLLAGMLVGPLPGLIVGFFSPVLSHLITGMPPMLPLPILIFMMVELPIMGLVSGLLYRKLRLNIFFSLIAAMLAGRVFLGLTFMFMSGILGYQLPPLWTYISGAVVTGIPGIVIQLILIPLLAYRTERGSSTWAGTSR